MKPGRELDALIAEKVMGLEPWPTQDPRWECKAFKAKIVPYGLEPKPCEPPSYSTDIAAAWEVVEKLRHLHPYLGYNDTASTWTLEFVNTNEGVSAFADTAPHAICLAALKTVGAIEK